MARVVSAMLVDAGYELPVADRRLVHRLDCDRQLGPIHGTALRQRTAIAENVVRPTPIG